MNFDFTPEQEILRTSLMRYLKNNYSFSARHAVSRSDTGWRPEVWRAFAADLAIVGATFPQDFGGSGCGAVENMIVMELVGEFLVVEPYLETVVLCGTLLKNSTAPKSRSLIGKIVDGNATFALAHGEGVARDSLVHVTTRARRDGRGYVITGNKSVVTGSPWATHLIVSAREFGEADDASGLRLFAVDKSTSGIAARDYPTIDGRRASELVFKDLRLSDDDLIASDVAALDILEKARDEAIGAVCAEAIGCMRRMLDETVGYAKERRQFGAPIADFQAIRHRLADMYIELERATSMSYMATLSLECAPRQRAIAVSAAKVRVAKSCRFVGQNAIQIHGAMGLTDELPIGWYFKRATAIEALFGSLHYHLDRYEALAFEDA